MVCVRVAFLLAGVLLALLAPAAPVPAGPVGPVDQPVVITLAAFVPAVSILRAGDSVTWTNPEPFAHTATADGGGEPDSGDLRNGQSYTATFPDPGTITYVCAHHFWMKGVLVVV